MKKHYVLLICFTLLVLNLDAQSIKDNVQPLNYDAKSGQGKVVNNSSNVPVSTNKVLYLDEDWDNELKELDDLLPKPANLLDDDEISAEEAAFMQGYEEEFS